MPDNQELSPEQALEKISCLPEKEQRLCQGVALWLNGYSYALAARVAKCPRTTLMLRIEKSGLADSDRVKFAAVAETQAMQLAADSHRLLREKLARRGDRLSAAELNMIWGTSVDKLTRLQTIGKADHDGARIDSILDKISSALEGKNISLQIEPRRPDQDAIDVTPTTEETDQ